MANNYTSASFAIPVKNEAVATARMTAIVEWLNGELDDPKTAFVMPFFPKKKVAGIIASLKEKLDWGAAFDWEIDHTPEGTGNRLCLYHNETIDMEVAIVVAQIMLDLENDATTYTAEWADTCDKARTDQFGGGAVAFNRHDSEWMHTSELARTLKARLQKKGRR
jgi:hypothetical protein